MKWKTENQIELLPSAVNCTQLATWWGSRVGPELMRNSNILKFNKFVFKI